MILEDIIERTFLAVVVAEVDLPVVDINVVIHLPCRRPRRLQKSPSRNAQLLDSNSQFLEPPALHPVKVSTVQLQKTRTDKARRKALETMYLLAPAYVAEAADMVEVRVWLLVSMDEVVQLCVVVVPSNFHQCKLPQMLELEDKVATCRDEVDPLDTIGTHLVTSRAIGETNLLKANHNKISKAQWATSKASNKVDSNLVIAIGVQ